MRPRNTDPNISDGQYHAVHQRLFASRGKASTHSCARCGAPAHEWAYRHNDPNERHEMILGYLIAYSGDLRNYEPLCRSCHRRIDKGLL